MQTVSRLAEADWKAWEIEEKEWKLATRNSRKGEKQALQCELIFSWFLFILQILLPNPAVLLFDRAQLLVRSALPSGTRNAQGYGSQCGCQSGSGSFVTWRMLDPSERMINISA